MTRAVVHIGTHKTGSTSIQSFLDLNRDALQARGFAVPAMWDTNHQPLALLAYGPGRWDEVCAVWSAMGGVGGGRPDETAWLAYLDQVRAQLGEWAGAHVDDTLVLSSETLYSHLFGEDIDRLGEVLSQIADDVTVIVYVREPLAFRLSLFLTEIILGRHFDPLELEPPVDPGWERLADWERVFPGRVRVRLFDPVEFVDGSLLRDFCTTAEIPWSADYALPERENESLSWPTARVLNAVNAELPLTLADGSLNPARGRLWQRLLASDSGGYRYRPTPEAIAVYREHYAETNEWLRRSFFPEREHLWTTSVTPREPGTDDLYAPDLTNTERTFAEFILRTEPELAAAEGITAERDLAQAQLAMIRGGRLWRYTRFLRQG